METQIEKYRQRLANRILVSIQLTPNELNTISKGEKEELKQTIIQKIQRISNKISNKEIAISIKINSLDKSKPELHKVLKHIVDIFRQPLLTSNKNNKSINFLDRQIKYLSIKHSSTGRKNYLEIEITPFLDFLQDLELSHKILSGYFEDVSDHKEIKRKIAHEYIETDLEERKREYNELLKNQKKNINLFGEELFKEMLTALRVSIQDEFIFNIRSNISYLYYYLRNEGGVSSDIITKNFNTSVEFKNAKGFLEWRKNVPLFIELPLFPLRPTQKRQLLTTVKESLNQFLIEHEIMSPLYSPIMLDAIYAPTERNEHNCEELNDIMELVVPEFNSIFKLFQPLQDRLKRADSMTKSNHQAVVGYNSLEIPRISKSEKGWLLVSISRFNVEQESVQERIDKVITHFIAHYRN